MNCDPAITISNKDEDRRNPKLVFQKNRSLVLCKWECPVGRERPSNLCLITTRYDPSAYRDPNQNQAGWLSFTTNGVEYMSSIGVTFPAAHKSGSDCWIDCRQYGRQEHGNRRGRLGTSYQFGFDFGTPDNALRWLVDLFVKRGKTVCKCDYTDDWPSNLSQIWDPKKVAPCP